MSKVSSGRVDVADGFLTYHRTGGAKPALVLSHGLTDNGLCWSRLARALEADFDLIMLDGRGHGDSVRTDGDADHDPAEDLAQAIEGLAVVNPIVMGHSIGARTTARFASLYPERVAAVILEDPPLVPQRDQAVMARWQADLRRQILDFRSLTIDQIIALGKTRSPTWHDDEWGPWATSKAQVDPGVRLHDPEPWQAYMARLGSPTLLLFGEPGFGGLVTPAVAREAHDLNPLIQWAQIDGAGHNIRRENFEAVMGTIRRFLATI